MDRLRRLRREFPPLGELDDVAWDLVRELVRVERSTQRLSVSALSMAAEQVSSSTAVRRIQDLVRAGVLLRTPIRPMRAGISLTWRRRCAPRLTAT